MTTASADLSTPVPQQQTSYFTTFSGTPLSGSVAMWAIKWRHENGQVLVSKIGRAVITELALILELGASIAELAIKSICAAGVAAYSLTKSGEDRQEVLDVSRDLICSSLTSLIAAWTTPEIHLYNLGVPKETLQMVGLLDSQDIPRRALSLAKILEKTSLCTGDSEKDDIAEHSDGPSSYRSEDNSSDSAPS